MSCIVVIFVMYLLVCSFTIPVGFIIFEGIGLAAFAAACPDVAACEKIAPMELLSGE